MCSQPLASTTSAALPDYWRAFSWPGTRSGALWSLAPAVHTDPGYAQVLTAGCVALPTLVRSGLLSTITSGYKGGSFHSCASNMPRPSNIAPVHLRCSHATTAWRLRLGVLWSSVRRIPRSSLDARQSHSTTHAGTALQVKRSEPVHAVVCNCTYSIDAFLTEQVSCVRLDDIKCTSRKVPRVMMPRAVHVLWSHTGSSLCCPSPVRFNRRADMATTSWFASDCAALHKSAVSSKRPRLPGGVCKKAERSCPDPPIRLSCTAQT
jgi:hypothetical protein